MSGSNKRKKSSKKAGKKHKIESDFEFKGLFVGAKEPVYAVKFNPYDQTRYIFAATIDKQVLVLECNKNALKVANGEKNHFSAEDDSSAQGIRLIKTFEGNDKYFSLDWSYDEEKNNASVLAFAGQTGIIQIVSLNFDKPESRKILVNHTGAINDLKFHPSKPNFLASASEDLSVRLWNIQNCINVAVLSGELHSSQVLALEFHPTGDYIASCGMDHTIVIWSLNEAVKASMEQSEGHSQSGDFTTTVVDSQNAFKTDKIHNNYVDSIIWLDEDSLISRSSDDDIVWWKPGATMNEPMNIQSDTVTKIHSFQEPDDKNHFWFVRMDLTNDRKYLAIGNHFGKIHLWKLGETMTDISKSLISHPNATQAMHMVSFSPDGRILIAGCQDGKIIRFDLKEGT